jgi:carbonic anhydrase/acetyltransferase-like protein (isoleucine patch superfamily)
VTWTSYPTILRNKDAVVGRLLRNKKARWIPKQSTLERALGEYIDVKLDKLSIKEPLIIFGGLELPKGVRIGARTYFGQGVEITETVINAPTFIEDGAQIEYSRFQDRQRHNYIGPNAKVSNVEELRGCFISGGPKSSDGREKTYVHADSINNVIIGAYAGMSDGTTVFNHPLEGEQNCMVDWHACESVVLPDTEEYRKLPILLGLRSKVGPACQLNGGSVVEAGAVVPRMFQLDGIFLEGTRVDKYFPTRRYKPIETVHV